jgi:tryptophan synthase alpha chain
MLLTKKEAAFIPYITVGDPSLAQTKSIIKALADVGADIIECGVPFSDPIGDGPVIQEASARALSAGANMDAIFSMIKDLRTSCDVPLLLFTYYNPLMAYGLEKFAKSAADAGVDGVLCVDLPPEEADDYKDALNQHGLCTVFLCTPTTREERLEHVARQCSGFVYYVSRTGVTGESAALQTDLNTAVARIKKHTALPIAVGFGISKPEHAKEVAIVRLIGKLGDTPDTPAQVASFAKTLIDACKSS